jgi:hypothetical protein
MSDTSTPQTNPALADIEPLVGSWRMELFAASFLPDPTARVTSALVIEWIEHGTAVVMRQGDGTHPPAATWIIGRDESDPYYQVLYADGRGVSRVYQMTLGDGHWTMSRTTPEFSQRFDAQVQPDGVKITGRWEKSTDGGTTWEHDFNVDYLRT